MRWADARGGERGAVIAGAAPPVLIRNVLNGLPGVRFDGANRALRVDDSVRLGREYTIIVVAHARSNVESRADTFWSYCGGARCDASNPASVALSVRKQRDGRVVRARVPGVDATGATSAASIVLDRPTVLAQVRANSRYLRTYAGEVASPVLAVKRESGPIATQGKALRIGGADDDASFLTGDVFELLVYDRALSAGELRELFDYLNDKWFAKKSADAAVVLQSDLIAQPTAATFGGQVVRRAFGRLHIVPDSPAHSPDAWYRDRGRSGSDRLDGALEFFARFRGLGAAARSNDSTSLLELAGGANRLKLSIRRVGRRELAIELSAHEAAEGSKLAAWKLSATSRSLGLVFGRRYHIAVTVETNPLDGRVMLKLFAAPGGAPIDVSNEKLEVASAAGTALDGATDRIQGAFRGADGFDVVEANGGMRVEQVRVWRGVPRLFDAFVKLPDVAAVLTPQPEPPFPAAFEPFLPPIVTREPVRGAPAIAEWTRSGEAGDSLALTGDLLSARNDTDNREDTRFVVYGQNADSLNLTSASIHRLHGRRGAIKLDASLPRASMYLLWPINARGAGRPVAVNRTEAWWVGPDRATRGDVVSIYGRNLSHDQGATVAYVYLKPNGRAAGRWITPSSVNPYRVEFRVPEDLADGDYELWAHNGHGGRYGWSKPVSLTLDSGITWTGATFDVTADGTDSRADDSSIQATVRAAAQAAAESGQRTTVQFPRGRFYLTESLWVPSNVRLLGAGPGKTVVAGQGEFRGNTNLLWFEGTRYNELANLTLDLGTALAKPGADAFVVGGAVEDFCMHDVRVIALRDGHSLMYLTSTRASFANCEFIGTQVTIALGHQIAFDRCNFYAARNSIVLFLRLGVHQFSITRSTAQDYNAGDDSTGAGWSHGRFVNIVSGTLGSRDVYIGENTTHDLGVHPNYVDQNTGEQVSWDEATGQFVGKVIAATANTVAFREPVPQLGATRAWTAVIIDGKGEGQIRDVTEVNGKSVRLDAPWNVIPDATSTVALGAYHERAVVYRNRLDGKAAQALRSLHTASAGIEPYGGMSNLISDGNIITDCRHGTYSFGAASGTPAQPTAVIPSLFHLYTNNLILGSRYASRFDVSGTVTSEIATYGYVFRGNTIDDSVVYAGQFIVNAKAGNLDMIVFDRNLGANMPDGYAFDYYPDTPIGTDWLIWVPW